MSVKSKVRYNTIMLKQRNECKKKQLRYDMNRVTSKFFIDKSQKWVKDSTIIKKHLMNKRV